MELFTFTLKKEYLNQVAELVKVAPLFVDYGIVQIDEKDYRFEFELINKCGIAYFNPWHKNNPEDREFEYAIGKTTLCDFDYLKGGDLLTNSEVSTILGRIVGAKLSYHVAQRYMALDQEWLNEHFDKETRMMTVSELEDLKKGSCLIIWP